MGRRSSTLEQMGDLADLPAVFLTDALKAISEKRGGRCDRHAQTRRYSPVRLPGDWIAQLDQKGQSNWLADAV